MKQAKDGEKAERFSRHRAHLFALAYRMLGSVAEAEDVLQESFLRFAAAEAEIDDDRAFLTTIVSHRCLDELRSARARRETYVGPWLPEPLLSTIDDAPPPPDRVGMAESLRLAFLVLLEQLSPDERVVFLLREVFDEDFSSISRATGKSEAACRQLLHRAREHVHAGRRRRTTAREEQDRVMMAFLQACSAGDTAGLLAILGENAALVSDGGGKVKAARKVVHGADRVARFLVGALRKGYGAGELELREINGQPGLIVRHDGVLSLAVALDIDDGRIAAVQFLMNPDKLRGLDAPTPGGEPAPHV